MPEKQTIKVLQRSSQIPDLSLIEMLWWDLKRAATKQMPANLIEEWAKIPQE